MPASASCSEAGRPQAIVFDVDGTLVDTLPAVHSALNAVLGMAGHAAADHRLVRRHFSAGMHGLLKAALAAGDGVGDASRSTPVDPALEAAFGQAYLDRVADLARPFDGVAAMLADLAGRGLRLGVCSNGASAALQRMLSAFGWQSHFSVVVDAGNARALKPSPAPLQQVLHGLQAQPADAWLVGDSELDGRCARAAGCRFVWVACGYGGDEAAAMAHSRLADPADLPALLAGVG